jgi:hypothetical protein
MKKILLLALLFLATPARPGDMLYDSGVVASGGVITGPVICSVGHSRINIMVVNADAATRSLSMLWYKDAAGTDAIGSNGDNATATSTSFFFMGAGGSGSTWATRYLLPFVPPCFKAVLNAGGTSNGRVLIYGSP